MMRKNVWVAGLAMPVSDCAAAAVRGISQASRRTTQPPAANAEVKIDNFSFGPDDAHGTGGNHRYVD